MYKLYYGVEFIDSFEDLEETNKYINNVVEEDCDLDIDLFEIRNEETGEISYYDEDYVGYSEDNDEEEEDYEPIPTLKGVGVRDTDNGFKIVLMGVGNKAIETYDITMNIKGYEEGDLFGICYNISQRINSLYYQENGNLTQEQVLNVVREEMIK